MVARIALCDGRTGRMCTGTAGPYRYDRYHRDIELGQVQSGGLQV